FFQAEDGIRVFHVTGVQTVLFRSADPDGGTVTQHVVACSDDDLTAVEAGDDLDAAARGKAGLDGAPDGAIILDDEDRLRALTANERARGNEPDILLLAQVARHTRQESGAGG